MKLVYAIPKSNAVKIQVDLANLNYTFNNPLSYRNCEINLIVYEPIKIGTLEFKCVENCYSIIKSSKIKFKNITMLATNKFDVNAISLFAENLKLQSRSGRFQLNYLELNSSGLIDLERGDIIVQSKLPF